MEAPLLDSDPPDNDIKASFSLRQQASRWLLSILCVAFLFASLKIYQDKGNLTPTQLDTFVALFTALPLLLGLAFFVSPIFDAILQPGSRFQFNKMYDRTHSRTSPESSDRGYWA